MLARDPNYRWDRNQERVKDRTLKNWMELVQKRTGLSDGRARVHILRHTFCSRLADAGAHPRAIQRLAGHESFTTTEKHIHDGDALKDQAIALLTKRASAGGRGARARSRGARPSEDRGVAVPGRGNSVE